MRMAYPFSSCSLWGACDWWGWTHYPEATAVEPDGRLSNRDLGIWSDHQGRAYEYI
jgi:lipopolysaccharide biosynthesis protein